MTHYARATSWLLWSNDIVGRTGAFVFATSITHVGGNNAVLACAMVFLHLVPYVIVGTPGTFGF